MATGGHYFTIPGLIANGTSLAAKQYYIVQHASTAGQCKLATSATSKILGVLQNDPAAGEACEVAAVGGIFKVMCEASVSLGDRLTASSTGRAKTSSTSGNVLIGQALEAYSTAAGIIMCGPISCNGTVA